MSMISPTSTGGVTKLGQDVGVDVGVLVGVGVFVVVGVGAGVFVVVGVAVGVGVLVGVATVMSTEPSSVEPSTLPPDVLPNDADGSSEKLTAASVVPAGLPTFNRMETISLSGNADSGGKKSIITKSNSLSVSVPSKVTDVTNPAGRLNVMASGMPSPLLSAGSKLCKV